MKNYEYIIAGLPQIQQAHSHGEQIDADAVIASVRELLDEDDAAVLDFMLSAYESDNLTVSFYQKALKHKNAFIRSFFEFDLNLRNAKVAYLNKALSRPAGKDIMEIPEREERDFEERAAIDAVLQGKDIIKREKGLDDIVWEFIEEQTMMEVFSLDLILSCIAKLKIIDRWNKLDPETGAAFFRKLVKDLRATYDNKKNNII